MKFKIVNGYSYKGEITPCKLLVVQPGYEADSNDPDSFGNVIDDIFYQEKSYVGSQWIRPTLLQWGGGWTRRPHENEERLVIYLQYNKGLISELRRHCSENLTLAVRVNNGKLEIFDYPTSSWIRDEKYNLEVEI